METWCDERLNKKNQLTQKQRNPSILHILDPMHRSLLNNNIQYEKEKFSEDDEQPVTDSDEYFTCVSVLSNENTASGAVGEQNVEKLLNTVKQDSNVKRPTQKQQQQQIHHRNMSKFAQIDSAVESNDWCERKNRRPEPSTAIENKKQTTNPLHVAAIENRCDNNYQVNSSNAMALPTPHHQQEQHNYQRYINTNTTVRTTNDQIKTVVEQQGNSNKLKRRSSSRISAENKAPLSRCHSDAIKYSSKQNAHKRSTKQTNCCSDSSDVNSEQNLVIENMRNRECEMFRKISFNNGYFSTTGSSSDSYMHYTSDTNSVVSSTCQHQSCNNFEPMTTTATAKKLTKVNSKRKCRSFPLTENQRHIDRAENHNFGAIIQRNNTSENVIKANKETKTKNRVDCIAKANTFSEKSRKITITIKTKSTPNTVQLQQTHQIKPIDNYFQKECVSSDESDTTVSDYATLRGESVPNSVVQPSNDDCAVVGNQSTSDSEHSGNNSFFSVISDNEYVSETSQYFNCLSQTDLSSQNKGEVELNLNEKEMPKKPNEHHKEASAKRSSMRTVKQQQKKSPKPMICIEQELSKNREVTSKIEIDKEQLKEFKRRQKKRSQRIIDKSFSEEIFSETLNVCRQTDISCDKEIINSIVASLDAESRKRNVKNIQTIEEPIREKNSKKKFIDDGFAFEKLNASPKYTGKSISRLLAHRIEQQTMTNVRRTLLQNVAFAITDKAKFGKKKFESLPPIKPPRSFTASASSSPLSKQSFESSATVPIAELIPSTNKTSDCACGGRTNAMGFVIPSVNNVPHKKTASEVHVSEETTHIGWIRPAESVDNDETPMVPPHNNSDQQSNSLHYYTAPMQQPPYNPMYDAPKEDIDMVDSPRRANYRDFEHFSANLSEKRHTNSTPIKNLTNNNNTVSTPFVTVNDENDTSLSQIHDVCDKSEFKVCKKCHCHIEPKSSTLSFRKTGKKIGKALKHTKSFIGTSKKLLKKSPKQRNKAKNLKTQEIFHTPLKDGDNTVRYNQNSNVEDECKKRVEKSLNLTPKNLNQMSLHPSPKRVVEQSKVKLLKDAPANKTENDSDLYVTPDEAFNYPVETAAVEDKPKSVSKRSPSKMISKLAKSSKKLFRRWSVDESTHYYKANDYDEVDNKVLLMGEMLSELRKQIEDGNESCSNIDEDVDRPASAKKCLFRANAPSISSCDLLDQDSLNEQIARIDLHDEPEPLYAEIQQEKAAENTMFKSCIEDEQNEKYVVSEAPVNLREVYINDRNDSLQPSKYIMVNDNPKILYATVNRNSVQAKRANEQPTDNVTNDSFKLSASYDSLDMSLINDFATAVQTELDECQSKIHGIFSSASNGNEDKATMKDDGQDTQSNSQSDLNSGCSSFYQRSKQIMKNSTFSEFDTFDRLSFDTVGTASYCESISRGNDVNSEIKDTITSLEYLPSDSSDSSHEVAFKSCLKDADISSDSNKFVSFNRAAGSSIESSPNTSLYRTVNNSDVKKKSKKLSPNFNFLKNKFRNSLRIDNKKSTSKYEIISRELADTSETKSIASTSNCQPVNDVQRKLFESIADQIENMASELTNGAQLRQLIDEVRKHQEIRKELQKALDVCRCTFEFHNSRELVEAEELMLMSCIREFLTLEELVALWQNDRKSEDSMLNMGMGNLSIKYLEFELKVDAIYDAHFNYFYLCVCSYRDQVATTTSKERQGNRMIFNNLKMHFTDMTANFKIRVDVYALRLRKNAHKDKDAEPKYEPASRFRLHGKAELTSFDLSRKQSVSSYHSPSNLQQTSNSKYVYASCGLISPTIVLCGQGNTLCDSLKIGYQEKIYFDESKANGFLNIADSNQKWDRLWCRIDGFSMDFWKYPQDRNDTELPLLSLDLEKCNHRHRTLLVDREICPKPRTFKLDIVEENRQQHRRIKTYFISAETQLELELWLSEIQKIFEIIKHWNI